jgi:hypothetical protein
MRTFVIDKIVNKRLQISRKSEQVDQFVEVKERNDDILGIPGYVNHLQLKRKLKNNFSLYI